MYYELKIIGQTCIMDIYREKNIYSGLKCNELKILD